MGKKSKKADVLGISVGNLDHGLFMPNPSLHLLPEDVLLKIFSYMSDAELLKNFVPVCTRFRQIIFAYRFRFNKLSLGEHWGQWYCYSEEFLDKIQPLKSLSVNMSIKYQKAVLEKPKCAYHVGISKPNTCRDRKNLFTLMKHATEIEKLSIIFAAAKKFKAGDCKAQSDLCQFSCASFLKNILSPVSLNLKELFLRFSCSCDVNKLGSPPVSFQFDSEGEVIAIPREPKEIEPLQKTHHVDWRNFSYPLLGQNHLEIIASCSNLKRLTIFQSISSEACSVVGQLVNLAWLELKECDQISNQALLALKDLPLTCLKLSCSPCTRMREHAFTMKGLKDFFEKSLFSSSLATLALKFSDSICNRETTLADGGSDIDTRKRQLDHVNDALKCCPKLERLELNIFLLCQPDLSHMTILKELLFDIPASAYGSLSRFVPKPNPDDMDNVLMHVENLEVLIMPMCRLPSVGQMSPPMFANIKLLEIKYGSEECIEMALLIKMLELCSKLRQFWLCPLKCPKDMKYVAEKNALKCERGQLKHISSLISKMHLREFHIANINDFDFSESSYLRPFPLRDNQLLKNFDGMGKLKILHIGFAVGFPPHWFSKICKHCPLLEDLYIFATEGTNLFAESFDEPAEYCNIDLLELKKLSRLATLKFIPSFEPKSFNAMELFSKCNAAFPMEPKGDHMSPWPSLLRFVVKDGSDECSFKYRIIKTCLGEIKRILEMKAKSKWVSVSLNRDHVLYNKLPPAFVDSSAKRRKSQVVFSSDDDDDELFQCDFSSDSDC